MGLWNEYTKQCIDSLYSDKNKLSIVLIDNNSQDETAIEFAKLKDTDKKEYHYIHNDNNNGCSSAWNQGIKYDKADYYFVINNDTLFNKYAIDNLVDYLDSADNTIVMATCCDMRDSIKPQEIINLEKIIGIENKELPDFSAFMISQNCIDKVGWFDEGFSYFGKAYFEDNDFALRIKLSNLLAMNISDAPYYHFGSKTQSVVSAGFEINHKYFKLKWGCDTDYVGCYKNPFNDVKNDLKWVWQNETQEARDSICKLLH